MLYNLLGYDYVLRFELVVSAEMATDSFIDPRIDRKHRGKKWADGEKLTVLVTRCSRVNWMIHPDWVQR